MQAQLGRIIDHNVTVGSTSDRKQLFVLKQEGVLSGVCCLESFWSPNKEALCL